MPYIPERQRKTLDSAINDLATRIRQMMVAAGDGRAGLVNYSVFSLVCKLLGIKTMHGIPPIGNYGYADLSELLGALGCCKDELYRRIAAPYENLKALENGDIGYGPPGPVIDSSPKLGPGGHR